MGASDLRKKIIEQIESIQDEGLLKEIYRMISIEHESEQTYTLTTNEREGILSGVKDVEEGRFFTSDQAKDEVKKWLGK